MSPLHLFHGMFGDTRIELSLAAPLWPPSLLVLCRNNNQTAHVRKEMWQMCNVELRTEQLVSNGFALDNAHAHLCTQALILTRTHTHAQSNSNLTYPRASGSHTPPTRGFVLCDGYPFARNTRMLCVTDEHQLARSWRDNRSSLGGALVCHCGIPL